MLKHESELDHLPSCICTKNMVTGYVLDHDCGRTLHRIADLEREAKHRQTIAAVSIGQDDRAQCIADRERAEEELRRARRFAGLL